MPQKQLQKAVEIYPKYAAAWYELGDAYYRQNNRAEARKALTRPLRQTRSILKPYRSLAAIAADEKNWQEVADTTASCCVSIQSIFRTRCSRTRSPM